MQRLLRQVARKHGNLALQFSLCVYVCKLLRIDQFELLRKPSGGNVCPLDISFANIGSVNEESRIVTKTSWPVCAHFYPWLCFKVYLYSFLAISFTCCLHLNIIQCFLECNAG